MNIRTFKPIVYIYNVLVFGSFFIWGFSVQNEEGLVHPSEHELPLTIFIPLMFIGLVLAGVNLSSVKDKSEKVSGKAIVIGISIAVLFLGWRILMSTF